ncbi:MAG: hypothetical protein MUE40_14830 [Anaerolineae bacterium]|jgi:hypothetical protein|nr:hypothetical protein [Anaerolineae bacterium]
MIRQKLLLMTMLVLAFVLALPAAAQETPVFCGTLAEADCQILRDSSAAAMEISSGSVDYNGSIVLTGVPDTPDITIGFSGDAAYDFNMETLMGLATMTDMPTDPAALFGLVNDIIMALNSEMLLNISLPEEVAQQAGLPVSTITLDMSLVDGIAYINFDPLDALSGGMLTQQNISGWGGINLVEAINVISQQALSDPQVMDAFMQGFNQGLQAGGGTTAMNITPEQVAAIEQYVNIARTDDGSGSEAEFTTSVDIAGLFTDEAFQALLREQIDAQAALQPGTEPMTDAQFQQVIAVAQTFGSDITVSATQRINTTTFESTYLALNLAVDLSNVLAMSGQGSAGDSIISFSFEGIYGGYNATTIAIPAGAQVLPTEQLIQLLGGM